MPLAPVGNPETHCLRRGMQSDEKNPFDEASHEEGMYAAKRPAGGGSASGAWDQAAAGACAKTMRMPGLIVEDKVMVFI